MHNIAKGLATTLLVGALTGAAQAQTEVLVTGDISTSETWTANNTYNLQGQIYVLPGASLTIEAGTVVASDAGGSLAVTKGAQIFVQGTQTSPVIMTSKDDVATWTGGDSSTGTWREAANEWGNLTLMGDAYISENATAGNTASPNANNLAAMEGLVEELGTVMPELGVVRSNDLHPLRIDGQVLRQGHGLLLRSDAILTPEDLLHWHP